MDEKKTKVIIAYREDNEQNLNLLLTDSQIRLCRKLFEENVIDSDYWDIQVVYQDDFEEV